MTRPTDEAPQGRIAQLRLAFQLTREHDSRLVPYMAGSAALTIVVFVLLGLFVGPLIPFCIFGVLGGAAVAFSIFGRRVSTAMIAQVEGKPGAATAVVQGMRGEWKVTPAVQVTRTQDLVHRAVGRPGVVLLGEGSPNRVAQLLTQEKRRVGRAVPDVPVYEFQVGEGQGQVSLRRLQQQLIRLPRNLKAAEVGDVDARLSALRNAGPPIPKGPLPRNLRIPRGRLR